MLEVPVHSAKYSSSAPRVRPILLVNEMPWLSVILVKSELFFGLSKVLIRSSSLRICTDLGVSDGLCFRIIGNATYE